ncbi:P-loop containing nucleoside triphosphate hydrolase protein [Hypoxylon rubiginosum]|uniref:P-loop containing nucleoside triphosphate hydrolase protein n=1 Tax=Hypoxylon rubiginosum TaxID=110542 RepID=A0ACC0CLL3_9PEZI|nr:P-loop containing nucleoside triphosphate hydrolase protein [Hypoxylon rubiginosum]
MESDEPYDAAASFSFSVSTLVLLNGKSLTLSDSASDLLQFGAKVQNQAEFKLKVNSQPHTYPKISLGVYFNNMRDGKIEHIDWVGQVDFYFQSLFRVVCERLSKDSTTTALQRRFRLDQPPEVDVGSFYLSFEASRVLSHFEQPHKMQKKKFDNVKHQVERLIAFMNSINEDNRGEFEFIFKGDHHANLDNYDRQIEESEPFVKGEFKQNALRWIATCANSSSDPLKMWFAKSPAIELLNARTILKRGETYKTEYSVSTVRPEIGTVDPNVKFHDLRQYKIALAYGTVDDAARAEATSNKIKQGEFYCYPFVLPCRADGAGNPSTLIIAIQMDKNMPLLPGKGLDCEISLSGVERIHNEPYQKSVAKDLSLFLRYLIDYGCDKDLDEEEFCKMFDIIQNRDDTPIKIAKSIEEGLKEIYSGRMHRNSYVDSEMVDKFVADFEKYLRFPPVSDDEDENNLKRWHSRMAEIPMPFLDNRFRLYLVKLPTEPWYESFGGPARRVNFGLSFLSSQHGENYVDYIQRILSKNPVHRCTIYPKSQLKTAWQEIQSHGHLQRQPWAPDPDFVTEQERLEQELINESTQPPPCPSEQALRIYSWLPSLETPEDKHMVNVFEMFPVFERVHTRTAPHHLQLMFDSMDGSKKNTFDSLRSIPHGMAVIPGTAGSGKTMFAMFCALMLLTDKIPSHKKKGVIMESRSHQILIVAPHNQILNEYETGFLSVLKKFGAPRESYPLMQRVYSMPAEIKAGIRAFTKTAEDEDESTPDATDHFLAEVVLQEYQHNAKVIGKRRGLRNFGDCSLHSSVLRKSARFPWLEELRNAALLEEEFDNLQKKNAEKDIKDAYMFQLRAAQIIFATPAAARQLSFQDSFEPTLVILDENSFMCESTTLMCLSSFPSAKMFMLLGDPSQTRPIVSTIGPNEQPDAPFEPQLKMSCLERLVRGGVALPGLYHNHRQWAKLHKQPSDWFYDKRMVSGIKSPYPRPVQQTRKMIGEVTGLHHNRVLVDIRGSSEQPVAASFKNEVNIQFVLTILRIALADTRFTSVDGKRPGTIAIVPFYDAQASAFEYILKDRAVLHKYLNVASPEVLAERVMVSTVDGFKGREADLVILDYVRTNHPGFTADANRNAVAYTRSIQGEIVLMNKSSFANVQRNIKRFTTTLKKVYHSLQGSGQVQTKSCSLCFCIGHTAETCTSTPRCARCFKEGHKKDSCPLLKCSGCGGFGHLSVDCRPKPKRRPCYRCSGDDHFIRACPHPASVECTDCGRSGHLGGKDLCQFDESRDAITDRAEHSPASRSDEVGDSANARGEI